MPTTLRFSLRTVRSGFTLTELLVAATLLIAVLSVAAQLTVRTDRLRQDVRREQIALDELATQLDRLLAADPPQRSELLANLTPGQQIAHVLPGARLVGEEVRDDAGRRLVLELSWKQAAGAKPLTLVGWIDPWTDRSDETAPSEIAP